jgi:hypothetical protein
MSRLSRRLVLGAAAAGLAANAAHAKTRSTYYGGTGY